MAIAFVLVGGISGFIAAVVTLLLGYGFWQAMLNYWQVAIFALISLAIMYLASYVFRALRAGLMIEPKSEMLGFENLKTSLVKQSAFKPPHR